MIELILILTPIALLDSTSMVPICIVFLAILLSGPNPIVRSSALLAGIVVTYLICGFVIAVGLDQTFDALDAYIERFWYNPNTQELVFQMLLGLVLIAFGWRLGSIRKTRAETSSAKPGMTATQALIAGAGMTIIGIPGAVPYLAAIDLIVRSDLGEIQALMALVIYNVVFVMPLAAIIVVRVAMGERGRVVLDRIKAFFDKWGLRVVVSLMLVLGAVLVADAIGWFMGTPLLPV